MDRIEIQDAIEALIEDVCNCLSTKEFRVFKKRIKEILEDYE